MRNRRWEPAAYTAAATTEIACMADAVRGVDPETRVPTCPEWSVAELVEHTGTVHRWATPMVRDLATERLDTRTLDLGLPDDAPASVGVAAPADALTLLLYGRSAPPRDRRYEVVGDEKVLARWLECSAL